MTWVVWRQGRSENVVLLALLAAVALLLVLTGAHMRSVFDANGLTACTGAAATPTPPPSCSILVQDFQSRFDSLSALAPWFGMTSGLIGVLLAAPLVLELDQGTYRLAWTQSLTPTRWLTTRVGWLVLGSIACGVVLIVLGTWWRQPLDALAGRVSPDQFDLEGVLPIAYTVLAASAVLAIGTVTRRTGLAVAGGFGAYLVARLLSPTLRQHLIPPVHSLTPGTSAPRGIFTAWVINHGFTDAHGHSIPGGAPSTCFNGPSLSTSCLVHHHVYQSFVYEPASRFWPLQAAEAGILITISLALLGLGVWWLNRQTFQPRQRAEEQATARTTERSKGVRFSPTTTQDADEGLAEASSRKCRSVADATVSVTLPLSAETGNLATGSIPLPETKQDSIRTQLTAPLLATCGVRPDLGPPVPDDDGRGVPRCCESGARGTPPRKFRQQGTSRQPARTCLARKPGKPQSGALVDNGRSVGLLAPPRLKRDL
ncbi:MAG: hypothetical protein JO243_00945, partial [Solirubrobacterales bacterium]|nr:hypothetical protein [Solirubrobacterales bacterium]